MKQYIGSKIVEAWPCLRIPVVGGRFEYCKLDEVVPSYVIGPPEDGYLSWSPKAVFEKAYRETTGLSFGLAIEAAKMGKKIARAGWNGKNQYVELAYCISYKNNAAEVVNVNHCNIGNKAFAFVGTSGVQMGWLASQADMLADDWQIVE